MKNFIDFVADAAKNESMATELNNKIVGSNITEISTWFENQGYSINQDECEKIMMNKDSIASQKIGLYY
ncbi:MAG: hypothetical protein OCD02_16435 [Spirochaetaceae bacterium]